jgi:chromatin remodeling complex protein RSC6
VASTSAPSSATACPPFQRSSVSAALAEVVGKYSATKEEAVEAVRNYIAAFELEKAAAKGYFLPNKVLAQIFGPDCVEVPILSTLNVG